MKKIICLIILFLIFPIFVAAGGGSDDEIKVKDSVYQTCTYAANFSDYSGPIPVDYTEYYVFSIPTGIAGNAGVAPDVSYEVKQQVNNGELYSVYTSPDFGVDASVENYILNISADHGTNFSLSSFMYHFYIENDDSEEKFDESKSNGAFCPSNVYAIQDYVTKEYKFMFCDGTDNGEGVDSCKKVNDYINSHLSNIVTNTSASSVVESELYDHIEVSGNLEKESEMKQEVGKQKSEVEQEIEDVCDPESPNYDIQRCNYLKGVSEEVVNNMIEYAGGYIDIDIDPIDYGQVTCATIFKDANGNYNDTHKLLSTSLRFLQYLAVTLALILSVVDYIKVVPTQDKDALMKATKTAVLRLGIAIVIFFVPIVLNFILELIGFNDPTCGLM